MTKYPDITVKLIGEDGNAFYILAAVTKALRRGGVSKEEQDLYYQEATASDYDALLRTTLQWVDVE